MAALCQIRSASKLLSVCRPACQVSAIRERLYSSAGAKGPSKPASTPSSTPSSSAPSVPGLSKNVLDMPSSEVGPGASKAGQYKNPEYFCYNQASYFEAEVEMLKYRCPQPSALTPK